MSDQFIAGLALAAAIGLPPGVIMAETIRRGIEGGFAPALAVQAGSLLGDVIYGVLGLTGAAIALTAGWLQLVIGLVGVVLMIALGLSGLRDALRTNATDAPPLPAPGLGGALAVGASLSLTNPLVIVFWLGFGTAASNSAPEAGLDGLAVIFAGYLIGLSAIAVALCGLVAVTRSRLDPRLLRWLGVAASLAILVLGAVFATQLLSRASA